MKTFQLKSNSYLPIVVFGGCPSEQVWIGPCGGGGPRWASLNRSICLGEDASNGIISNGHMGTLHPVNRQTHRQTDWLTDRHDWQHYLPANTDGKDYEITYHVELLGNKICSDLFLSQSTCLQWHKRYLHVSPEAVKYGSSAICSCSVVM